MATLAACNGTMAGGTGTATGTSGTSGGAAGSVGSSGASGSSGTAGSSGAAGDNGSGAAGDNGSGAAGDNGSGTAGSSGTTGAAGASGAAGTAGHPGTAGTTGTAGAGTAGTTGTAGAPGTAGSTGTTYPKPKGNSAGCGMAPGSGDSSSRSSLRTVHITGLNAVYLAGGTEYVKNSISKEEPYNYAFRPYGLRLPKNYNPAIAYPITVGGGGCGGEAKGYTGGDGLTIDNSGGTIQIGLQMMNGCFDDGGPGIDNRNDTPEEQYFRAVIADVEANYCADKSKVFISGYSSGGWEAYTMGCAAADILRGISADEGGMRTVRPTCKGPVAAVLVAGTADTENPIGPLNPANKDDMSAIGRLGSFGSAPGRDDLLMRNGCSGNATTAVGAFDATYSQCVKYTGCPEAYPVIWCALPGVGHNNSSYGGNNYSPGLMWKVLGALPANP